MGGRNTGYLILGLLLCSQCFAQEVIVKSDDSSLPVLNEELRKLRSDIASANDSIASLQIFEVGMIMLWSGTIATIPDGWKLCDGNNGTPNLTDKFVVGAKQDDAGVAKTNITGSLTQSGGVNSHTHSTGAHSHRLASSVIFSNRTVSQANVVAYGNMTGSPEDVLMYAGTTSGAGSGNYVLQNYNYTESGGATTSGSGANIPTYYALAYIMYIGT